MYGEGHNQCSKKQVGTYKTSVQYFVKAYVKQKTQEAEISGAEYDVDEEALNYLYCTQFIYNNNYVSFTSWTIFRNFVHGNTNAHYLTTTFLLWPPVLCTNWLQRWRERLSTPFLHWSVLYCKSGKPKLQSWNWYIIYHGWFWIL